MADPRLSGAAKKSGKKVSGRLDPKPTVGQHTPIGEPPNAAKKSIDGVASKVAKKAGAPDVKGLTPKALKAERNANKNASAKQKTGKILKDTVKGATGKSIEGAAVGGGLQGAAVGLAKGILTTAKGRWILALALLPLLPLLFWIMVGLSVSGTVNSLLDNNAVQTAAVTGSTGSTPDNISSIQNAAMTSISPWELMAAAVYYETGVGSNVAQNGGACPPGTAVNSICPSVVVLPPSQGSASASLALSSSGAAPTPVTSTNCVPSTGYVGIGIDCSVGRNGSVPAIIPPSSPDYTTTDTADWACIRQAESSDQYFSPNAPSGAYGILESTWVADGFSTLYNAQQPYQATAVDQNAAALFILNNHPNNFYPGWDDACTLSAPGRTTTTPTITAIAPGVEIPGSYSGSTLRTSSSNPSSTSSGQCPPHANGPYCVFATALSAKVADNVSLSSEWFGKQLENALYKTGADGHVNLLQGVNTSNGSSPPTFNPIDHAAAVMRVEAIRALGMIPLANNSATMDRNIYELATDWAAGYSPQAVQSCATSNPQPTSLNVVGPTGTMVLNQGQLIVAERIVRIAKSHNMNSSTEIAMIVDALDGSGLGQSATYSTMGVFGNGTVSLPVAVVNFLHADTTPTAAPAIQAAILGAPAGSLQPWVSAATLVVQSLTDTLPSCSYGISIPNVAGGSPQAQKAVTAAKAEVGVPYVWGGGGTSGVSMGLGGYGAPACSGGFVVSSAIYGAGNPCDAAYAAQTGLPGFDCSGLVQYAFAQAGVALPRTSMAQYLYVQARSTISTDVPNMQPGDLFFYFPDSTGLPDHVTIYLGLFNTGSTTSTASSCSPSKNWTGLLEIDTTCAANSGSNGSATSYSMTVTTYTPMLLQAPEEGTDVQVIPFYSTDFMGGGAAA